MTERKLSLREAIDACHPEGAEIPTTVRDVSLEETQQEFDRLLGVADPLDEHESRNENGR